MKKISALLLGLAALPMLAVEYNPNPPSDVVFMEGRVQSRQLKDKYNDKVTNYDGPYAYAMNEYGEFRVWNTSRLDSPSNLNVEFTVTNTYADGHSGNCANDAMSYRILVQYKGQTEDEAGAWIFNAENGHLKWIQGEKTEELEWIPNNFTDAWDISVSNGVGKEPSKHTIFFFPELEKIEKVGVQSRYYRSKKYYESEITWVEMTQPNLDNVLTWEQWTELWNSYNEPSKVETVGAEVTAEYYDLSGRRVSEPQKGLFVKKTRMADGSVSVRKVAR